jgi:hypothetical protein
LIYLVVGVMASKWQVNPAIAGAATGFTDATAGWLISAAIGPGRIFHPWTTSLTIIAIIAVTFSAVLLAAFGYLLASRVLYRIRPRR